MNDYKKDYYEQSYFWEADYFDDPGEAERISETIRAIPSDTHTLLDVGCGNGVFVNTLSTAFPDRFERVVGLDPSVEALKHVKTEKNHESIESIPFESESFDLVSCLEVLEHLPKQEFDEGISEIQRVSRKYILVSVPNDEILEGSLVLCPKCCCAFNPYFHMRSFRKKTLSSLFTKFRPITIREMGPVTRFYSYNTFLFFLRLGYEKPSPPVTSICPQCGYQNKAKVLNAGEIQKTHTPNFQRLLSFVKPLLQGQKKRWLLALYERADAGISGTKRMLEDYRNAEF